MGNVEDELKERRHFRSPVLQEIEKQVKSNMRNIRKSKKDQEIRGCNQKEEKNERKEQEIDDKDGNSSI